MVILPSCVGIFFQNFCTNKKSRDFFSWLQVEMLLWTAEIFMMKGRDFIMNGWDFHDDRPRFLQATKIFTRKGQDFIINGWDFHNDKLRFSCWQVEIFMMAGRYFLKTVEIFMMTGRHFYDDKSRFSWWQVKISLWTVETFMVTGRDILDERLVFFSVVIVWFRCCFHLNKMFFLHFVFEISIPKMRKLLS